MAADKTLLKKLKRDLRGKMPHAAEVTKKSVASISRVLSGKQDNPELVAELIMFRNTIISERSKTLQNLRKKLAAK